MNASLFSQNRWLFPDTALEEGAPSASLTLLKGQTGGVQILVTGLPVGQPVAWSLRGAEGLSVTFYREMEVCVNRNTNSLHNGKLTTDDWEEVRAHRVRRAPYRTYDPLLPTEGLRAEKDREVYYCSVIPRADATAGEKKVDLCLTCGGDSVKIPLSVTVGAKSLPNRTLNMTNWASISNMARAHGLEYGSDAHKDMVRSYVTLMRECHGNIFWITMEDLKAERVDGKLKFDFSDVERWAQLVLDCGIETLEWSPFIFRPCWEDPPFQIADITDGGKKLECLSVPGRKYLTAFLTQFNDFLTQKGWREISIVHVSDEPKERCAADFRILAGIFRKYLPGIKLIDAIEIWFLEDALDIYVPKNHYFQLNRNDFENLRDDRNELWFYTCNMPGGKFLNRFLDSPLLHPRLLHWGNYRYNLTGYLHWGFNHVRDGQDPFEETSASPWLPAGDTHIVYPYKDQPLRSLRFLQMKCGAEEYEILHALAETEKAAADGICRRVLRTFDDYITDVAEFDAISTELVKRFDDQ
ncbi:MAG: DUF4091 domain-containing protein [Clostridia bacterium]|nr:DUF4091 domain-containing protein [Clostridia bacterium]